MAHCPICKPGTRHLTLKERDICELATRWDMQFGKSTHTTATVAQAQDR